MRCPILKDLPPPPPGKTGWPWTEETSPLPDKMTDARLWPGLSIVTPSLNQGQFIEETIRSVLLQGYPALEYMIIDGGSNDETSEIIKKYEKWLAYWVSEPDRGQSHAINKGVLHAAGDIVSWLNSDDLYCKRAFETAVLAMCPQETAMHPIVYGNALRIDEMSNVTGEFISSKAEWITYRNLVALRHSLGIHQPSVFLASSLMRQYPLDENLKYVMDYDLWIRLSRDHAFHHVPDFLSLIRFHHSSKSSINIKQGRGLFIRETLFVSRRYWNHQPFNRMYFRLHSAAWALRKRVLAITEVTLIRLKSVLVSILGEIAYTTLKNRIRCLRP
ncbi:MAG: glycosyltransferase [Deltaproteobacteria bacterium]|nr:glycosyltransferase [Deltaproteobacteria bacterium]